MRKRKLLFTLGIVTILVAIGVYFYKAKDLNSRTLRGIASVVEKDIQGRTTSKSSRIWKTCHVTVVFVDKTGVSHTLPRLSGGCNAPIGGEVVIAYREDQIQSAILAEGYGDIKWMIVAAVLAISFFYRGYVADS